MQIRDIPEEYSEFEKYYRSDERTHFRNNATSERVAHATNQMFAGWVAPTVSGIRLAVNASRDG
jgi:hypothetical protein